MAGDSYPRHSFHICLSILTIKFFWCYIHPAANDSYTSPEGKVKFRISPIASTFFLLSGIILGFTAECLLSGVRGVVTESSWWAIPLLMTVFIIIGMVTALEGKSPGTIVYPSLVCLGYLISGLILTIFWNQNRFKGYVAGLGICIVVLAIRATREAYPDKQSGYHLDPD